MADSALVPHHDLDAEAACISACILDSQTDNNTRAVDLISWLTPESFYSYANRRIWETILELYAENVPSDIVTVAGRLRAKDRLADAGGAEYLAQLCDAVPSVSRVETYARVVSDWARLRHAQQMCQTWAAKLYGPVEDIDEALEALEHEMFEATRRPKQREPVHIKPILESVFKQMQMAIKRPSGITGVATGIKQLDKATGGLHESEVSVVAARPGMGKTAWLLQVCMEATKTSDALEDDETGVAIFSLEMPKEQLAARMLCQDGRVEVDRPRTCRLEHADWDNLTAAAARIAVMPIWIDDTPAMTMLDIRSKIRRIKSTMDRRQVRDAHGKLVTRGRRLKVVGIDYFQLMRGVGKTDNRERELAQISADLKVVAKEESVAIILLAQLNREVEKRSKNDRRPRLSDLRETGALEQDADNVIFLYREGYYDRQDDEGRPPREESGVAEIDLAKQRNGPVAIAKTAWIGKYNRFENLADGYHDGP
jgi:replicative DNA helicase